MNEEFLRTAIRIYRIWGIDMFRRFLFSLEKWRQKDNRVNLNYHISNDSPNRIKHFMPYILYNSILHLVSIAFILLFFVIRLFIFPHFFSLLDLFFIIVLLFNGYCLLLQHYTFLRLRLAERRSEERKETRAQRKVRLVDNSCLSAYAPEEIKGDIILLNELSHRLNNQECFSFNSTHKDSLKRFSLLIPKEKEIKQSFSINSRKICEIIDDMEIQRNVCKNLEMFISRTLCKHLSGYSPITKMIFSTDSLEIEGLYKSVFPSDDAEKIDETLCFLKQCYIIATAGLQNEGT